MTGTRFLSWRRSTSAQAATRGADGRLVRPLRVSLVDSAAAGSPATADITVRLRSAADVERLTDAAIRRRMPAPGSGDAETTKCTHVDFRDPDLPWRYTPEPVAGDRLRPWLALVVGTAQEVRVDGGIVAISPALLGEECHRLAESWRWAHVHAPDGDPAADRGQAAPDRFSRLLSLRTDLQPLTTYTAVLVPTFADDGSDMWNAQGTVGNKGKPLRVLDAWTFTTGEGGDFETICAELRMPPARDLGRAALTHRSGGVEVGPVDVRGALQSLQTQQPVPAQADDDLAQDLALAARAAADGPKRLGLPHYGRPWIADPAAAPAAGWSGQLREDARFRIHAGTGVWVGVEGQDELMRAAVEQAGALPDATARIGRAAVGVATSGSLWERALPEQPADRFAVLAPLATRMLADAGRGDLVLSDAVTGPDRALDRALFTAAGHRLLGRSQRHRDGATVATPSALWSEANSPAQPDLVPAMLLDLWAKERPDGPDVVQELARSLVDLGHRWADGTQTLDTQIPPGEHVKRAEVSLELASQLTPDPLEFFGNLPLDCRDPWGTAARLGGARTWDGLSAAAIASGSGIAVAFGPVQTAVLRCLLGCGEQPRRAGEPPDECAVRVESLRIPPPPTRRPVSLERLGDNLSAALDPRGPHSPARRHLEQEVTGLDLRTLAPPRFPLGLDYPTWQLLRVHEPDWLLPGAQKVAKHTITALRTNPAFVDAYLVGLNSQFLAEVRWRGLSVDRWGTPLRMFFGPVDPRTGKRTPDISPIDSWTDASPLGDRTHLALGLVDDPAGTERLVILLHTPLFRRYPGTAIYLQDIRPLGGDDELLHLMLQEGPMDLTQPAGLAVDDWLAGRAHIAPAFRGDISPDLVFFVFDIAPDALDGYLLVLDEPPSDLRFRNDKGAGDASSAALASRLADRRTRVAISGRHLEDQGRNPG